MLKKPWLMHKHVEVKWSRWLQVYGLDIQRCIHLSCNIFHKYMTLRNIYYARVIWMEFWNYTNNANTCNFFLFKASYYTVHIVRHLKKKNEDYKLNKIIFTVINIEAEKRVVCGHHFHGECILGVGVRHRKHVYCGTGSCRFRNRHSNGSPEWKLGSVTCVKDK